jgi:hypothetical protein
MQYTFIFPPTKFIQGATMATVNPLGGGGVFLTTGANNPFLAMTKEQLVEKLKDPNLPDADRSLILAALAMKASEANKASGTPQAKADEDEMQRLLKKLRNGTITQAELETLAGLMGVDVATLEKQKGKPF